MSYVKVSRKKSLGSLDDYKIIPQKFIALNVVSSSRVYKTGMVFRLKRIEEFDRA